MGDIAADLVGSGNRVTVVTTRPHAHRDPLAEREQQLRPFWWFFLQRSDYEGAIVYHSLIFDRTPGMLGRLISWMIFHLISLVAGVLIPRRVDVILTPSPLLSLGLVAWLLGLRHRCKFVYNVQELYPDLAVSMRRVTNRPVLWLLYRLENLVYSLAAAVTTITPEIRNKIVAKGVSVEKVSYIPNWVDTDRFAPVEKKNSFSTKYGLETKFVVGYAGNVGLAQSFDELLAAARILLPQRNIMFLVVGDGGQRDKISEIVSSQSLVNVQMLPYQPAEFVPEIYGSIDLAYVPLQQGLGSAALPSKVYRIMASATPVLALTDKGSGLAELVTESGCGVVIEPGSGQMLATEIERMANAPELVIKNGLAGRQFVAGNYSRSILTSKYINLLDSLK